MDVIHECRLILAAARPANGNTPILRHISQQRVDDLVIQLNSKKPSARTFERAFVPGHGPLPPLSMRVILHPSPALLAEMALAEG